MKRILRVDMSNRTVRWEEVPESYQFLAGRALTSRIVSDEVPAGCDPLGAGNKLIIAPGLLGGTSVPGSGRLSIGGKSPLTGGIKESNAGGTSAIRLARAGIRALILEGQAPKDSLTILVVEGECVSFENGDKYRHMGNYELANALRQEYGNNAALITIGPAGEMGLAAACIGNVDQEGRPSRVNGRGGLGAVMGAKGMKAIVIKAVPQGRLLPSQPERFNSCVKSISNAISENPGTKTYTDYGTAALVSLTNSLGCMPTRNFSAGNFEGAEKINGDSLRALILSRGGKPSHACMPGCIVKCSNVLPDSAGKELVAPLEYETIGLLGSNCAIDSLDEIARLNYLANDLGVDTIEVGAAIGVAMESGVLSWGGARAAYKAIEGMANGEILGRVLGSGVVVTGKVLGVTRVPAVKGQSLPAYDPRALKGLGVTYTTSAMGADHTAGTTLRAPVDHLKAEGQVQASKNAQVNVLVFDMLGLCMFTMASLIKDPELISNVVSAYCGTETNFASLLEIACATLRCEREFNRMAGVTSNALPEFFRSESLAPHGTVFDIPQDQLNQISFDC